MTNTRISPLSRVEIVPHRALGARPPRPRAGAPGRRDALHDGRAGSGRGSGRGLDLAHHHACVGGPRDEREQERDRRDVRSYCHFVLKWSQMQRPQRSAVRPIILACVSVSVEFRWAAAAVMATRISPTAVSRSTRYHGTYGTSKSTVCRSVM